MNYLRSTSSSPCVLFDSKETTVVHKTLVKLSYQLHDWNSYFILSSWMNRFYQLPISLFTFLVWTWCRKVTHTCFSCENSSLIYQLWCIYSISVLPCTVNYCWYNGLSQEMAVGTVAQSQTSVGNLPGSSAWMSWFFRVGGNSRGPKPCWPS